MPIAAVVVAGLIIGIGAVVAQTQEESPAQATETTTVATDQVKATASTSATARPKTIVAPTQSAMANPNIAKLPTGGGHEGRENHGDRETHSEGDDD